MTRIVSMGKFTAIGMRTRIEDPQALIINTCGKNDTAEVGTMDSWVWSNPTNRAIIHRYADIEAVSVEALWQGTKLFPGQTKPDERTLAGDWRRGKAKRPVGAWAGEGQPLIHTPGEARRKIYIPAFRNLINYWMRDERVRAYLHQATTHNGPVYLRDHDTGRGIDRNGPMSHAWVLATFLNTGAYPD